MWQQKFWPLESENSFMNNLKIYPFGGVAEIGSNMSVFETDNHLIVIDYGILFPNDDFFNINYLIADTSQLNRDKNLTLFITHGHEDHIGAITHFLMEFPSAKVYAPRLARELILFKLAQRNLSHTITLYNESTQLSFDNYTLYPVAVTHSIPDTFGIVLKSEELAVLFISDFKYDLIPSFENGFDLKRIQNLMNSSRTKLAMLDSTNILSPGKTLSESELISDFEKILTQKKRTFITMFSSNIYRIKNILELAKKHKKKIVTIGRSLGHYLDTADKTKILSLSDYPIIDLDAVQNHSDPNILYIVTGSQGEFLGATKRIITGNQKHIQLNSQDQFVFSSKPIPGNEKKIYSLYNQLATLGIDPITFKDAQIHASGHPCQEDLKEILSGINPDYFIPIHGETYFLRKHIQFVNIHFPKIQCMYLTNFHGVQFFDDHFDFLEFDEIQPQLIHGNYLTIERDKISERRKIADNGVIFVSLNHKTENIHITTKGLPSEEAMIGLKLRDIIEYCAFSQNKKRDHDYTIEQVRIAVRNFYHSILGYKPITIVHMV